MEDLVDLVDLVTEDGVHGRFDCEQAESLEGQGAGRTEPKRRNLLSTCSLSMFILLPTYNLDEFGGSYPPGYGLHKAYILYGLPVRYLLQTFLSRLFFFLPSLVFLSARQRAMKTRESFCVLHLH